MNNYFSTYLSISFSMDFLPFLFSHFSLLQKVLQSTSFYVSIVSVFFLPWSGISGFHSMCIFISTRHCQVVLQVVIPLSYSSGCYSKESQTGWLINSRNLFLTVAETGSLLSGCQHGHFLVRALFQVTNCQLLYPHMAEKRARELFGISL